MGCGFLWVFCEGFLPFFPFSPRFLWFSVGFSVGFSPIFPIFSTFFVVFCGFSVGFSPIFPPNFLPAETVFFPWQALTTWPPWRRWSSASAAASSPPSGWERSGAPDTPPDSWCLGWGWGWVIYPTDMVIQWWFNGIFQWDLLGYMMDKYDGDGWFSGI